MYSSGIVYAVIARELNTTLEHYHLADCFSPGKEEIIFVFERQDLQYYLAVKFVEGEMFFLCNTEIKKAGRKSIPQFKSLIGLEVSSIKSITNDRAFGVSFTNGDCLFFKGFGKFGNILHFKNEETLPFGYFRLGLKNDASFPFPNQEIAESNSEEQITTAGALEKRYPHLPTELRNNLIEKNFLNLSSEKQNSLLQACLSKVLEGKFYLDERENIPKLLFLYSNGLVALDVGINGLNEFVQKYLRAFYFVREKAIQIQKLTTRIKHLTKLEKENKKRLQSIIERRNFKEIGDIVMAFAHTIKPGVENALLTDFYTGNPIRIKLDKKISASANAEKFYKKAKNEYLEREKIEQQIKYTIEELIKAKNQLDIAIRSENFKDLNTGGPELLLPTGEILPYKKIMFEDYIIWLGKNAKSNDEMLRLAAKNDLWLHACGIAGSHVIIKMKGTAIPQSVINFAATVAAENSKAKGQAIVPVYCIERKFVVKFKGANPGEVRLLKETIVDAILN